jgi:1-acyl-sn-glycerol-3-phosphate acyltransferase
MAHPAPAIPAAPAAPTSPGAAALADLTWLNVADARSAFGLGPRTPLRGLADVALRVPARRFSRQLLALDAMVGRAGLRAGSAWICAQLSAGVVVRGPALPERGPLLLVANHPGLLDAAALCSAIPRDDLRILAITRPFLRALPNIAANLFAVGSTPAARTAAVRAGARHLRAGGALLTFPAGRIEPDPLTAEGAEESLAGWSESVDLIARLAGSPAVAPLIVGGVMSPAALGHPLARLRRAPADRRWLAAILQLMLPPLRGNRVRVQIGAPVRAESARLSETVTAAARRLIWEVRQP